MRSPRRCSKAGTARLVPTKLGTSSMGSQRASRSAPRTPTVRRSREASSPMEAGAATAFGLHRPARPQRRFRPRGHGIASRRCEGQPRSFDSTLGAQLRLDEHGQARGRGLRDLHPSLVDLVLELEEHAAIRSGTGAKIRVTGGEVERGAAAEDLEPVVTEAAGEGEPAVKPGAEETPRWRRAPQRGQAPPGAGRPKLVPSTSARESQHRSCPTMGGDANAIEGARGEAARLPGRSSPWAAVFASRNEYDRGETDWHSPCGRRGYIGR